MHLLTHRIPRLQWKLTFSYVFITAIILLLFELIAITLIFLVVNTYLTQIVLSSTQQEAPQAATYFVHGTPDRQALTAWLQLPNPYANGSYQQGFLAIVDKQERVITSVGDESIPPDTELQTQLSTQATENLQAVLSGHSGSGGLAYKEANGSIIAISPISGKNKIVQGALVLKTNNIMQANGYWFSFYLFYIIIPSLLFIVFVAGIIGPIAGFFTARNLTRRFQKLTLIADQWSQGDFAVLAQDTSRDELGQLGRHLNHMVEQLQNLLKTRQKLAILEERNRLARDLHDSVKQHIFVIALQLGTAKLRLGPQTEEIRQPLTEAEHVLLQVQAELKTLIRELRPVALEEKGFASAMQELVTHWSQQNNVPADLHLEDKLALPLPVEETFFRVTQEALANIARHSQASTAQVQIASESDKIILSIRDNGQGFVPDAISGQGFGLTSMRERLKALDGEIRIESAPGQGTCIIASYTRAQSEG